MLCFYRLTVFQVTPNGWAYMIGLFILFVERKMAPSTPKEFSWFYTLKVNKSNLGFFCFVKRAAKESRQLLRLSRVLVTGRTLFFFTPEVSIQGHNV